MLFILLVVLLVDDVAGVRSPERPVVPNVTALSSTEIRITWCRVNSNKVEIDHYELFIDTELEYSGIDVMYMAKRLKPWSWYEVKLRACGFSPGSCSPFSRPALVKTLRDSDNSTVIQSGVTLFKVIVVPTYMFILGVIAGVLAISFVLILRYLQCADLSGGSAFELPQYQTAPGKNDSIALVSQSLSGSSKDAISSLGSTAPLTKACEVDDPESHYLEIPNSEKAAPQSNKFVISDCLSFPLRTDIKLPSLYLLGSTQKEQVTIPEEEVTFHLANEQLEHQKNVPNLHSTQIANMKEKPSLNDSGHNELKQGTQNGIDKDSGQTYEKTKHWSNLTDNLIMPLFESCKEQAVEKLDTSHSDDISSFASNLHLQFTEQRVTTEHKKDSTLSHHGIVVAIDNSNIYIGAQECASMVNSGDRKRHVRVKLQNLVRVLERERTKTRGFACGSSPPATEHVWEVYRRLGYIVDLEDRRGKDEQRVDEGLHLWIYKALCELPPGVLVLATGDGMRGKSECDTSFPRCAVTALERGWSVEVYSWKHSLSSEWIKLTKKHPDMLTINYLDKYVNYITFVDGKYGRKCSPLPPGSSTLQT
ncbi:hypothetical protein ACROYT_G034804 [Oculina patagonica]